MTGVEDEEEDERWSDWEEDEGVEMPTQSLFGPARTFTSPAECMRATRDEFGFDILKAARALGLYERIQLVNYIRARTAEGEASGALVSAVTTALAAPTGRPWKDERFLQPIIEGDPILFSLGELDDDDDDDDDVGGAASAEDEALMRSALTVEPSAQLDAEPEALAAQMAQMRSLLHELSADAVEPRASADDADESGSEEGGEGGNAAASAAAAAGGGRRRRKPRTIAEKVDEGYFGSYTELGIHHTMLSDRVRTEAYRRAIQQPWMAGKRVLDIGCGTSILSLFAASAGAEHVYGVDASGIILHAQEVVRRNGLDDRVTLVRGKAEEIALPVAKVDVIISEWMGYFLLYEAMLPSVLLARDKWLAPGGLVMPNRATMQMRASSHSEVTFWDDVYGYDMGNVGLAMGEFKEADVLIVPEAAALSAQVTFHSIDIMTVTDEELDFNARFALRIETAGTLRTFIGSFETMFDPPAGCAGELVELKTGMADPPTHWKQTLFHVKEPVAVRAGDRVDVLIAVARLGEGRRDLDVSITWSVVGADGQVSVAERSQLWQV